MSVRGVPSVSRVPARVSDASRRLPALAVALDAAAERGARQAGSGFALRRGTNTAEGGTPGAASAPVSVYAVLGGEGVPLAAPARRRMESQFGHDLARVRVHFDPRAARAAEDLGARAFAWNEHIVFGAGRYAPGTARGDELLAHELAHVIQQRRRPGAIIKRAQRRPARPETTR
jgi:hypothetical protein